MELPANIGDRARRTPRRDALTAPTALDAGKLPPQDLAVERAVLGALMLEKDALPKVIDLLKPEVFYRQAHADIFRAILTLFRDSEPVDIRTVTHQLRKEGALERIGGPFAVVELTKDVASAAHVEYHAHILVEKYLRRELIRMTAEVQRDSFEDTHDVFDLLDRAEQELYQISSNNLRRESISMNDLTLKTIKYLESLKDADQRSTGVPSGFPSLDEYTAGWQKGELIIVAARPAMGKTAFTLSLARNAALLYNKPVAFFSLEMSAQQLAMRMISAEAELNAELLRRGKLEAYEWEQLHSRIGRIANAPIYIDDTAALSIYELRAKCRRLKVERKIEMIIIDYLQLMSGDNGDRKIGNREQEIASISRALKQLSKELEVPVIALSQLSRSVETRGGDKRPMLSDLRESGSIEQDADMVIFLYRPEYYDLKVDEDGNSTEGIAEVIIGKQRSGPVGKVRLQFVSHYAKFLPLDDVGPSFRPQQSGVFRPMDTPGNLNEFLVESKINRTPPPPADDDVPF